MSEAGGVFPGRDPSVLLLGRGRGYARRHDVLRKILVISLAGIGDTLMATPILHELRVQFPEAEIRALVLWRSAAALLAGNPHLNVIHQHDFIHKPKSVSLRFLWRMRGLGFDGSINLHPQGRREYRWVARFIGARRRFSHEYENQGALDRWLVTDSVPQDYTLHCIDNNLALLGRLGLTPKLASHGIELWLTDEEKAWGIRWLEGRGLVGKPLLGVHVGSGGTKNLALRRWPLPRYAEVLKRCLASHPSLEIILFGGPEEETLHEELHELVPDSRVRFADTPTLKHAAAVLGHCRAFLSVDTVFMHLAAAVGVPRQFVIQTPTLNPPVHPRRADWTLVPNPAVGNPLDWYRYDGRNIRGTPAEIQACMEAVTADAVSSALASGPPWWE